LRNITPLVEYHVTDGEGIPVTTHESTTCSPSITVVSRGWTETLGGTARKMLTYS
jgi:hypothetical protein